MPRKPWYSKQWRKRREEILEIRNHCEWCQTKKPPLTMDHVIALNSFSEERYMALLDEDIVVLCKRCAYARLKGFKICISCHRYVRSGIYLTKRECQELDLYWQRKVHLICNNCTDKFSIKLKNLMIERLTK